MFAAAGLDNIGPGHDGMDLHGCHHNTILAGAPVLDPGESISVGFTLIFSQG